MGLKINMYIPKTSIMQYVVFVNGYMISSHSLLAKDFLSMLGLKLIFVNRRGPGCIPEPFYKLYHLDLYQWT